MCTITGLQPLHQWGQTVVVLWKFCVSTGNRYTSSHNSRNSWVIYCNSVTVESEGSFLSGFDFYEGLIRNLAPMSHAKMWTLCESLKFKWPPPAISKILYFQWFGLQCGTVHRFWHFWGQGIHICCQFDDLTYF